MCPSLQLFILVCFIKGIFRICKCCQFKMWGKNPNTGNLFISPHYSLHLYPPEFVKNTLLAIKLQTTPKHRLRKCMGGKKQAAKWPKKLRALGSGDAGRDCFWCMLNPKPQGRAQHRCRGEVGFLLQEFFSDTPKSRELKCCLQHPLVGALQLQQAELCVRGKEGGGSLRFESS